MNPLLFFITLLPCLFIASLTFGQHTFSICAVDTATGEVGSAGASCIENSVIISDIHPGRGVIHTQAAYIPPNQNMARMLMSAGFTPKEIIDSMVANDNFLNPTIRQYGAAGIYQGSPQAYAFTGENCIDYKNHITGSYYAIQGNILTGQAILDSMEARFLRAEGDLACRLMEAMQGANVSGADTRCISNGNSSLSAFLRVAKPDDSPDSPSINLIINSGPQGFEPIDSLQHLLDLSHNCQPDTSTSANTMRADDDASLRIFPNPADGKFIISGNLPENAWIEVFDNSGKRVLSEKITSREIGMDRFSIGNYVVKITSGQKTLFQGKLIGY